MINRTKAAVTIAASASLSDAADLLGYDLVAIHFPAAWTAASITFQGSEDGITYGNIYDSAGTEVAYAGAAADRVVLVNTAHLGQFPRFVKVRSGTAGVPVVQVAAAIITLIGRTAL